jgi:vitamin B12 transporter
MHRISFAIAALLGSTTLASAQSPAPPPIATLGDTIVTATRVPTPSERVPASITVITRREIEERGYATLAEALQFVPGVRIAQLGGAGQQASVFLRGNSSRSTLVLLDGVPINDPSEPNGAFNFGNDSLFDIERIEILRGPASSMYGASAVGGVVNLVSRRAPADRPLGGFGDAGAGSQRTVRGGLGAGGTIGAFDYLGTISSTSTQSFNALASRFTNTLNEADGFRGAAATARLGANPNENSRIEAMLRWRENVAGLDSVPRDDPNYTGQDRRWFGQLRGETRLFDGLWTTGLRLFVTEDRRSYKNLPDQLSSATTSDLFRGTRSGGDWGNTVRLPAFSVFTDGAMAFGASYYRESSDSASGSPFFRIQTNASQEIAAGHASLQYRAFSRLDLTAGFRYDSVSGGDSAPTWRLGAVLALPEISARFRASAGSAFNAPSLFQRFGAIGTTFRGNPDLKPERSLGYEFGGELDIPALGRNDFATAGVTFFQSRVEDLINFNARFNSLTNIDRASITGTELLLALRPAPWLTGEFGWTFTQAVDDTTNRPLPRRPESVITATLRIAPIERLVVVPQLLFTGRSLEGAFASYTDSGRSIASERRNKTATLINLTANYQIAPRIALFVQGLNLANTEAELVNGFAAPGRSVVAGTRFTF